MTAPDINTHVRLYTWTYVPSVKSPGHDGINQRNGEKHKIMHLVSPIVFTCAMHDGSVWLVYRSVDHEVRSISFLDLDSAEFALRMGVIP